ncbi:hypothetical protein QSV08_00325 [Maribacter sp. BPC-D8]|uniref:hypothetical protein n=1 Tax=Maribacter sp. BPC-D8 TaxID=3053613 RepID=UPI002B48205E|nr:hypothetical protein [Maribacter sp. BPC-D8]WRI29699.1 hypothetical protein QSV08_00325 [Maribacter sp. BPC-D8]
MKLSLFTLLLFSFFSYAQYSTSAIVLDSADNSPLEFVGIYNSKDHTMTNADGRFQFTSSLDSVVIYRPGHETIKAIFSNLKDTILLEKSVLELDEVVVTNQKSILQEVYESLNKNYSAEPYKEKFMLRAINKYNGEMHRIEDITGKLSIKNMFKDDSTKESKKDFIVELINMRKLGLKNDAKNAYLVFPSLKDFYNQLTEITQNESLYDITEKKFNNGENIKIEFIKESDSIDIKGYYIIKVSDFAVQEYKFEKNSKKGELFKNKHLLYRTSFYKKHSFFKKKIDSDKYYLNSGNLEYTVITTDNENSFEGKHNLKVILITSDNFGNFQVTKNANATKDLFKLDYPYNPSYWNEQNQLLLTDEMTAFIEKVQDPQNDFKISSNLKN